MQTRGRTGRGSSILRAATAGALAVLAGCLALAAGAGGAPGGGPIGFLGGWGKTGSGPAEFRFPVSLAIGPGGVVYVADSENDRVKRFTEGGRFLGQWGGGGIGPGQFRTPEAVAIDPGGNIYVADKENNRIQAFTATGAFLAQWGAEGEGPGQLEGPESLAIDSTGAVYVADTGNDRIQKFSAGGTFLLQWGGQGRDPGRFNTPHAVAVDPAGAVYVADAGNDRIQKFTGAGAFVRQWGESGDGRGELDFPVGVDASTGGRVYVADAGNDRIVQFDGSGRYRTAWGGSGPGPGQLTNPVAVAPGRAGRIFVADAGNDRIQFFGRLSKPSYGKAVNLGLVGGTVRVRLPGSKKYVGLGAPRQLPVGTAINANAGRVRLSSAAGRQGGTQTADFYSDTFRVLQPKRGRPVTVVKLVSRLKCGRSTGRRRPGNGSFERRRKRRRGLWGNGKGKFRSQGRHGSATVRGTIWRTQDTCKGTLFKVRRGVVTVRDFTRHRKLKLRRGQRYLAPRR